MNLTQVPCHHRGHCLCYLQILSFVQLSAYASLLPLEPLCVSALVDLPLVTGPELCAGGSEGVGWVGKDPHGVKGHWPTAGNVG